VQREATRRGYRFDAGKIGHEPTTVMIAVNDGQLAYELTHLRAKLETRDRAAFERLVQIRHPSVHPLFRMVGGGVEDWEVV
jgi:hypothetical protein